MMCSFATCASPVVLVSKQKTPVFIAVDDTAIYWSNYAGGGGDGALMKLAKP